MGGKIDWVGKKLTSQIFPRGKKLTGQFQFFPKGKNGPAHSFPGEKTDWGKTDRYTGIEVSGLFDLKKEHAVFAFGVS